MTGFIRTVLIIILVFYVLRWLGRIAFPWIMRFFVKRAQKNFEKKFKEQYGKQKEETTSEKGDVKITYKKKGSKKKPPNKGYDGGEYVDFEEVDE